MTTLTTERLILRRPAARDWPQWHAFMSSERSRTVGGPRDLGQSWRAFAAELGHWDIHGFGMWAVTMKGDDTCIGMVGPWVPADWPETEVGWMIFADNLQGKGVAREAAEAAIDHAWNDLGWQTVVSYVSPENTRSIALAERLGARHDPDAPQPRPEHPCLVYRHPRPQELAS